MTPTSRSIRPIRGSVIAALVPLGAMLILTFAGTSDVVGQPLRGGGPMPPGGPAAPSPAAAADEPARVAPGALEFRFTDDRLVQLKLREDRLAVVTPYGRLLVPVADIRRVELGTRIPNEAARKAEAAIADLGSPVPRRREAAQAELLKLREKAYPALLEAVRDKDAAVAGRAEAVLDKLRDAVSEDQLEFRKHDVIHTAESKICGRIEGAAWKALTLQAAELQVSLADLRGLRADGVEPEESRVAVLAAPAQLYRLGDQVGKTFRFRVTGATSGAVWGTDVYTLDSSLAAAAVHAGALKPGQTRVVKVKIEAPLPAFTGSTRNGVTSYDYGAYPSAYRVVR